MAELTLTPIASGHWLDAGAAASWARMLAAGMPTGGITEAGRTNARQTYLYSEYLAGRLVAYAARPGESLHESGLAIDVKTASAAQAWLIKHGAEHGWHRPLLNRPKPEPWHWEYRASHDQHLTDDAAPVAPIERTTPTREDSDMYLCHVKTPWGTDLWCYTTATGGANVLDPAVYQHLAQVWPIRDMTFDAWQTEAREAWTRAGLGAAEVARRVAELTAPRGA